MVLTQQLLKTSEDLQSKRSFHTTMVLTQLIPDKIDRLKLKSFHTTMVLTQPGPCVSVRKLLRFPYHYGSYATQRERETHTPGTNRFHTTMVLTQRFNNGDPIGAAQRCFHTTMVLTQHVDELNRYLQTLCFHTTMVLTQRKLRLKPHWNCIGFHTTMVLTQPLREQLTS